MHLISNFTDQAIVDDLIYFDPVRSSQGAPHKSQTSNSSARGYAAGDCHGDSTSSHVTVKSLAHKCRLAVRRRLADVHHYKSIKEALEKLPLPKCVKDYVACLELISCFDVRTTLILKSSS